MRFSTKTVLLFFLIIALSSLATAASLERSNTLVISGTSWEPPTTWNPLRPWTEAKGTGGLVYEYLFNFDPLTNTFIPWLAESGKWLTDDIYQINLRQGIKWTDGEGFSAEDVAFTFELAYNNNLHYTPTWNWLNSVKVVDEFTVNFYFDNPHYDEWNDILYGLRIIPKHIWSKVPSDQLLSTANKNPIGTGPYFADEASQDKMIWKRNNDWWGNDIFGQPKPQYIVDLVNFSNIVTMGMLIKGELDLSNNFIPGVNNFKDVFNIKTWYQEEPYMLPWNTAGIFMNVKKKPMDDTNFRKALACSIKTNDIVDKVYGGLVKASNPTGLFGEAWLEYYDEDVAYEYGFSYNPKKANEILDKAGYIDTDNDGWRNMPDGTPFKLKITVPSGWTDWIESIKVIANSAQAVGINLVPDFPDHNIWLTAYQSGDFDMIIENNGSTLSPSPFTYWNWVANSDIHGNVRTEGNFSMYDNEKLFEQISRFNSLQDNQPEKQKLASDIQMTLLRDMPFIPLWHNGLWAQQTEAYWTNWPDENNPYGITVTYGDCWQMGMIKILINIEAI